MYELYAMLWSNQNALIAKVKIIRETNFFYELERIEDIQGHIFFPEMVHRARHEWFETMQECAIRVQELYAEKEEHLQASADEAHRLSTHWMRVAMSSDIPA